MLRFFLLLALVLPALSMAEAVPLPNEVAAPTGKMTPKGAVTVRVSHAGETCQAWIASLDCC